MARGVEELGKPELRSTTGISKREVHQTAHPAPSLQEHGGHQACFLTRLEPVAVLVMVEVRAGGAHEQLQRARVVQVPDDQRVRDAHGAAARAAAAGSQPHQQYQPLH